eukprot:scaffold680177_cov51-Prasinocladus_malaysianus.AAC.1
MKSGRPLQAQAVLEKLLDETSGKLHPHHAIRFAATRGLADACKLLGQAEACIEYARVALECMKNWPCPAAMRCAQVTDCFVGSITLQPTGRNQNRALKIAILIILIFWLLYSCPVFT